MQQQERSRLSVYIVSGLQTSDDFFQPFIKALRRSLETEQQYPIIRVISPFSNNMTFIHKMYTLRKDMWLYPRQIEGSVSGNNVTEQILQLGSRDPLVLIGYGGGGPAAYHAAELLEKRYARTIRFVIQMASPKVPIGKDFRHRVGFIHSGRQASDPLTWQGTWSHQRYLYSSHRYPGLLYNAKEKGRSAFAPQKIARIDLPAFTEGYFSPSTGKGAVSNLAIITNVITNWCNASRS